MNELKQPLPVKPAAPKLPKVLPILEWKDDLIQDEEVFTSWRVADCTIEGHHVRKVLFQHMRFEQVTFTGALQLAEFSDVVFFQCDLSNADFSEVMMHRCRFEQCRMVGLDLTASTLRNIGLEMCSADYVSLRFANLKQILFRQSSLTQADFYHTEWTKLSFEECNIDKAQMSGTRLAGIDLSSCQFYNLGVGLEELQGCIITAPQAILFSKIFGLVVKEDLG
ncbi:pentapeptide repeat-containing protein [Paenibacillus sp. JX-17]|uniref:Pentapeptide repeat-containing protein n=1 Tax=Paenibacillus lacisoli TaxID=3064525 RepID=A0ABT9CAS6_9BACL|nr:pentapeptide repeat-containing protein [Paenibacillus sp. JX-17]MDO7905648.1 pentapeptide repeat-containing protein [Paenibacillus sp. JX-17]